MEGYSSRRNPSSLLPLVALATLLALALQVKTCNAATDHHTHHPNASTEFIRTSCGLTPYPRLCFATLSSHSSTIQTSPKRLAYKALSVSLIGARRTHALMSNLSLGHGMKRREVGAMKDCVKTVSDSVDQLRRSLKEMEHLGGPDLEFQMSNIRTWVSAALTDDDTCMDGFADDAAKGEIKDIVRRHVLKIARLTSNALALVTNLASVQTKFP